MRNFIEQNKKYIVSSFLLLLVACNIIIWHEVFKIESAPDMRVSFLDVGQGDAIFISSRDGAQILIDGGPNSRVLSILKNYMPYYDRSIDIVVATHQHKDHISGLIDVLKMYNVGTFIESGAIYNTPEYYELEKIVKEKNVRRIVIDKPSQILFYNDAKLKLLTPGDSFNNIALKNAHDADIISEIDFDGRKILMMGDAEKKLEQQLIGTQAVGVVDVLKVGHHGSKTSSIDEFLNKIRPKYAVISVGKNNYGHPTQDVLNRLASIGASIFRTDLSGTINIAIQNDLLTVQRAK